MATQQAQIVGGTGNDEAPRRPGRWRRFVAAALVASSTMLIVDIAPAAAGTCAANESGAESRFVTQLNSLRQSRGLGPLAAHAGVADGSTAWSVSMSGQDKLQHDPNYAARIASVLPDWSRAGENVGVSGMTSCANVDAAVDGLHRAFVNSPGHFQNMIGDFNQVGIGVHTTSQKLWVTVRFAKGSLPKAPTFTQAQLDQATRYIDTTFKLFVNRSPSGADVAWWSPSVASGNRAPLTKALAVSDEWAGARISALYRTVLGREAETSGRLGWVAAISRGMQLETVAGGIYGSTERFIASGSDNRGYVEGLYRDILGRPSDPGGLDDWTSKLDRRAMSREQVAAGFYGSIESRRDRVRTLYQEILGRGPDPAGLSHWTSQLSRMGDVVLASTLATSTEYWNRATT